VTVAGVLTEDDVLTIDAALREGESQPQLAAEFGVTQQTISAINTGKAYSELTGRTLLTSAKAQLTVEDVIAIDQALREGIPGKLIAEDYAVTEQAISNIKRGRNWTWITGRPATRRNES
jgi:transcriptional regulator with XRE-family HTH domain